jgi:hypothetical protein
MKPQQIVECSTQRWSIETTCQDCRDYVKLDSPQGYGQATVLRFTPCFGGLSTTIVRLYRQLPKSSRRLGAVSWTGTATVTCSDMMTCVRRARWEQWCFHTPQAPQECSNLSRSLQDPILYALAPAA